LPLPLQPRSLGEEQEFESGCQCFLKVLAEGSLYRVVPHDYRSGQVRPQDFVHHGKSLPLIALRVFLLRPESNADEFLVS
jgi:hypothetical protein